MQISADALSLWNLKGRREIDLQTTTATLEATTEKGTARWVHPEEKETSVAEKNTAAWSGADGVILAKVIIPGVTTNRMTGEEPRRETILKVKVILAAITLHGIEQVTLEKVMQEKVAIWQKVETLDNVVTLETSEKVEVDLASWVISTLPICLVKVLMA